MVYVHTILRDVAGLFKVGRLVAYDCGSIVRNNSQTDFARETGRYGYSVSSQS